MQYNITVYYYTTLSENCKNVLGISNFYIKNVWILTNLKSEKFPNVEVKRFTSIPRVDIFYFKYVKKY